MQDKTYVAVDYLNLSAGAYAAVFHARLQSFAMKNLQKREKSGSKKINCYT